MVVPPSTLSERDIAEALPVIESRFSLEGRMRWAEDACKETRKRGWTLPDVKDISKCIDALFRQDATDHPEADVSALVERFRAMSLPEIEKEMPVEALRAPGQN